MESRTPQQKRLFHQSRVLDEREKARILRTYAGIFPNNIEEFANTIIPKMKKKSNFSK